MSFKCQPILCLAGFAWMLVLPAPAQIETRPPAAPRFAVTATNLVPPPPTLQSPVTFFRQLLLMSPVERSQALAARSPESRARLLAKVREYLAMPPDEREVKLRATELRWYLVPLMRLAPGDREGLAARVPEELQPLVKTRLTQWDLLPPPLQKEFLTNDQTLHYFAQTFSPASTNAEQEKVAQAFNQIFELTPGEKKRLLATLSEPERAQMEKTLKTFGELPPPQRLLCVRNYAKFAGMSGVERAEFLKNADSWAKLSPGERQAWRDLVAHVPLWPPVPAALLPPPFPPHIVPKAPKPSVATN